MPAPLRLAAIALALASACYASGPTRWLAAGDLRLKANVYRSATISAHPRLVVVLHGDSPFHPPGYQYAFARRVAAQTDDVVVAAILRPGYTDDAGATSGGTRGQTNGDSYTPQVIDAIAAAIADLQAEVHPRATFVVGHSGGAAIAADLLGRAPRAVDGALLVACPCDLPAWRMHMAETDGNAALWSAPVASLSPLDLVGHVSRHARVRMLVGTQDQVAPLELTERYASALSIRGVAVTAKTAPGLGHDILLEDVTFTELAALLAPP